MRTAENLSKTVFYCVVQGPLLIAWTRLPGTRGRKPPLWKDLAAVIAPIEVRASLSVGGMEMGSNFAIARSTDDMTGLQNYILGEAKPPPAIWSLLGAYMRGHFTALGPAFIKFGQILSMREELPPVIRRELCLLQDKLPPMSFKQVRKIIEREMDRPLEEVFEYVGEKPVAAASLAQVHHAKLRKEQEEVALKIQRPHLQGIVALDVVYLCDIIVLGIVRRLLPTLAKGADFGIFTTSFRESLAKEIDFHLEERTQSKFRKLIMDHPLHCQSTKIAKTYREYTTTKMLTMEFVHNFYRLDRIMDELTPQQLLDFATTKLKGLPESISIQLMWAQVALQLEGLSRWGFSHGDVHLGNLYALAPEKEGDPWKMFLCDFGMMIEESEAFRSMALEAGLGLSYYWDGAILGQAFAKESSEPVPPKNLDRLIDHMRNVMNKYFVETQEGGEKVWRPTIQRGSQVTVISDLMYGCATLGLKLTPAIWLLLKNFSYICNAVTVMWIGLNATQCWAPHPKKYVKDMVFHDLEAKNITNLRDSLPEVLGVVREYDRQQILNAVNYGSPIVPLEMVLTDEWDVRELATSNIGGDGHRQDGEIEQATEACYLADRGQTSDSP